MSQTKQAPMLSFMILQRTQNNQIQKVKSPLPNNSEIDSLMRNSAEKDKTVNKSNLKKEASKSINETKKLVVEKKPDLKEKIKQNTIQSTNAGKTLILL
jgi:hypothetical protein